MIGGRFDTSMFLSPKLYKRCKATVIPSITCRTTRRYASCKQARQTNNRLRPSSSQKCQDTFGVLGVKICTERMLPSAYNQVRALAFVIQTHGHKEITVKIKTMACSKKCHVYVLQSKKTGTNRKRNKSKVDYKAREVDSWLLHIIYQAV